MSKVESKEVVMARAALQEAKQKAQGAAAALAAERESEAAILARLELERVAAEREAQRLDRERAAEPIYLAACREHGEPRVARIHTVEGPLVFRPMSEVESDDLDNRQEGLSSGVDKAKVAIEAAVETVLYPSPDELRRLLARYPALCVEIFGARNAVQKGVREELRGKA